MIGILFLPNMLVSYYLKVIYERKYMEVYVFIHDLYFNDHVFYCAEGWNKDIKSLIGQKDEAFQIGV